MDLLDRLLGHDAWTTSQLLARCRELPDTALDEPLGIDHGSLRATLDHMIGNVEVWTDLIAERPVDRSPVDTSLEGLIARHERGYASFAALARAVRDAGRWDDTFVDTLDDPPRAKTFGGAVAHVITHDMNHRAGLLAMLAQLGVENLPEGDALSWEEQLERAARR